MTSQPAHATPVRVLASAVVVSLASQACDDLDRFDNDDGSAYCGNVVSGAFVRSGFDNLPRLQLQLDMDSLHSIPGRITMDDASDGPCRPRATFENAPLRISTPMQADALSQLNFGDGRELNLLTWVDSTCDGTYLAVVSLLHNDNVEVRVMRSEADEDGEEVGPFGVFKLSRHAEDCGFD